MPRISTITTAAPTSNVEIVGILTTGGSTVTRRFIWSDMPGVLPTSAGTSGQLLQTSGGVPTWVGITSGNLLYGNSSGEVTELTTGTDGQFLSVSAGSPAWADDPSTGHITTAGTSGQLLQTSGGAATWIGLTSGGIFYGNSSGEVTVLGQGSSGQVLQTTGGIPAWVDSSGLGISSGMITTAGSSGQVLQTTGGAATWVDQSDAIASLGFPTTAGGKIVAGSSATVVAIDDDWSITAYIDGNGSDLTTGVKGTFQIPWAAGIEDVQIQTQTTVSSGSFAVDLYVDDFSSTPASSGSKITGADPPTISSGSQRSSGITSSWTTAVVARDWVTVDVIDASSGITEAAISIFGKKLSTV